MGDLIFLAFENHLDCDVILEHIMRSVEVVFEVLDLFHLSAEVAGKVKGAKFERLDSRRSVVEPHL